MYNDFSSQEMVREEKITRSYFYLKAIILGVITIGMSFFVGSFLQKAFGQGMASYSIALVPLLISTLFFLMFYFLVTLTVDKKWFVSLVGFISGIVITVCIYTTDALYEFLIVGGVLVVLLILGGLAGQREMKASLKIRFVKILNAVVSRGMLGIAVCVAFLVYQTAVSQPLTDDNILLPRSLFEGMIPVASQALKPILGDIDLSLTLNQLADKGVTNAIAGTPNSGAIQRSMTPEMRVLFVEKYIEQIQTTFKNSLGITVQPNQKMSEALYTGFLSKFNSLDISTKQGIAGFLSVLFLLGIQIISWVLRLIMIPIAFILYEIGIISKFITVTFKKEDKEIIVLG
ncbi:MAG: hypothetical protein WC099_02335 [Candidatus Paceibacterota bacterium]